MSLLQLKGENAIERLSEVLRKYHTYGLSVSCTERCFAYTLMHPVIIGISVTNPALG